MRQASSPLYRDPIFDGAADPMVIQNAETGVWQMFYTQRRANVDSPGVAYCYGCTIGVAEAEEDGNRWFYRGALALDFEPGHNTFWAPEIIRYRGEYHMYVTYIRGVRSQWGGRARILHYKSPNLWDWTLNGPASLEGSGSLIDACAVELPGGKLRMWYKNEADDSHIWAADSDDAHHWRTLGPVITDTPGEGPNVFSLGGFHWMVVDIWNGQAVYRSDNLSSWARQQEPILRHPGLRPEDGVIGGHADVVVHDGRGFIFYFTHPMRPHDYMAWANEGIAHGMVPYAYRRTSIQAAELRVENGWLCCDRDAELTLTHLGRR